MIEKLLFEMPHEINATEFKLDVAKINRRVTHDFKIKGEKLEAISDIATLYKRGNRIALVINEVGVPTNIIYYVQWKEIFHKFVGHQAIGQVALWADKLDPRSRGIAARIFWEFLLPLHDVLITDALQTPDGQRFWRNRIAEAFDHHLRVYYLNLLPESKKVNRELIEIHNVNEFNRLAREKEFWGREDLHKARKIIISNIAL